jgi:hypothetical protein
MCMMDNDLNTTGDIVEALENLNKTLKKLVIVQAYQNMVLLAQTTIQANPTHGSTLHKNIRDSSQVMLEIIIEMEQ